MRKLSEIDMQIMWTRLISIVEEQAQALIRTAFSTSVREAGDLSAGVYDSGGQMLAQAVTGTPGHVNAMAEAVAHFIHDIGSETMCPGDVYLTNDPWKGTGHLHDITVVTPTFHNKTLIGFFACTAHVTDIGGRGFGADGNSVFEEGIRIPIMRFLDQGAIDTTLIALLRVNTRQPDQLIGDIHALAACNQVGQRRLAVMLNEFVVTDLEDVSDFIRTRSREATEGAIAALPDRTADGHMRIDGFDIPIDLRVRVTLSGHRIHCDWSGTSGVSSKGINVPLIYTKAYACYALKCAIAPEIPNNAGSLAPFTVSAPVGTIVNAVHPAPVALRHVIGHMVPDTVFGALDELLPGRVPAEGAGCLCNFQMSLSRLDPSGEPLRSEVLTFNSGGSGAHPTLDGLNATAFPSGVMTMPVEATEHAGPVVIWKKELRPDSGGNGTHRGGLGQVMEVGGREKTSFTFSAMLDRVDHPARGRKGGLSGAPTVLHRSDGTPMRGKGKQAVPDGQTVHMAFPGGGGYGPPDKRDHRSILIDLARGYISADVARTVYGLDEKTISDALACAARGNDPE